MKICPECRKSYDDSWAVCLEDKARLINAEGPGFVIVPAQSGTNIKDEEHSPAEENGPVRYKVPWYLDPLFILIAWISWVLIYVLSLRQYVLNYMFNVAGVSRFPMFFELLIIIFVPWSVLMAVISAFKALKRG